MWRPVTAGCAPGLAEAVDEARRARARAGQVLDPQPQAGGPAGELSLARAGRLLGESFLPGPVAAELGRVLARGGAGASAGAARPGGAAGAGRAAVGGAARPGRPRPAGAASAGPPVPQGRGRGAARVLPGPLRIVVAIAAPEDSGGGLLDYERDLRNVIAAVRAARQDDADVRVVPFATTAAIRAELDRAPAHVLHIYGHGQPGQLELEDEDGSARLVSADEFAGRGDPAGARCRR